MTIKKNKLSMSEIVESHKPKHFKYKYIINDDTVYDELLEQKYDLASLDTINDDMLVKAALDSSVIYTDYSREEMFHKAKEPTIFDNGVVISRKMVTKADKKLLSTSLGFFSHEGLSYVSLKLKYEKFDIMEIFILT